MNRKSRYYIRSNYHDWSEVDRVSFDIYKEKVRSRYAEAAEFAPSSITEGDFVKRYTKVIPAVKEIKK